MHKGRFEAFSDAVVAIVMTIMVLDLKVPPNHDLTSLLSVLPTFLCYLLSFTFIAIYWNNHHHMLQATKHVNGASLWANMHLLFWLSIIPFATNWMGQHSTSQVPIAFYGSMLFMCGVAYFILAKVLVIANGPESEIATAFGKDTKGMISMVIYAVAIACTWIMPVVAYGFYVLVALMWFIPDRRVERLISR